MALRAGYYGLKKKFIDKLNNIIPVKADASNKLTTESEIKTIWENESLYNLLKNNAASKTQNNGTITVNDDKSVTVTTESSFSGNTFLFMGTFTLKAGRYILSQGVETGTPDCRLQLVDAATTTTYATIESGKTRYFALENDTVLQGCIRVPSGWNKPTITFYPMIYISDLSVDNLVYKPYAADNFLLMQTVNEIITAATGAADFAAFKTAMGAITPVTRSLYIEGTTEPDSRSIEEPVVEKKTTTRKKSTAKAETTEEV